MGSLFSKQRDPDKSKKRLSQGDGEVSDKDKAVLELKNARDRLKKYRKQLEKDSLMLTEQAKKLIAMKQKGRALLLLKLRRSRETEATKLDKELLSILEMISNVEWEYANMEVLKALKLGNAALNKLHQEMSVDDVVELLEQTNEAIEVENRINEVFASQFDTLIDNGELERELAELMGEYEGASPGTAKTDGIIFPQVPSSLVDLPASTPTRPAVEKRAQEQPLLA